MPARVTGQTQVAAAVANLQAQAARQARLQGQISSGRKVTTAADDPAAFAAAGRAKALSQRLAGFAQTVSDATAELNGGVAALLDANRVLAQAEQLAGQAVNADTDPTGRAALADEVDALLSRFVGLANSEQDGRHLFGGTADDKPPFQPVRNAAGTITGVSYTGSGLRGQVATGPGQTTDTRYNGAAVFQGNGADAFASLIAVRDALRDPALTDAQRTAALTAARRQTEAARDGISRAVGEQSAALANLEAVQGRFADLKLSADERSGLLEGTDYAEAVLKLREQENVFQATLAVSARLLQPSLLDFVR